MNTIMIIMMGVALVSVACLWGGWICYRGAWHDRDRARASHCSALEAKALAEKYHQSAKNMNRQALESFAEGQEFWSAATHALLDAKQREARVEGMLEKAERRGLISAEWREVFDGGVSHVEDAERVDGIEWKEAV